MTSTLFDLLVELMEHVFRSLLCAIRWGLIAFAVIYFAGKGCASWPMIKHKPAVVQQVQPPPRQ
jgi:hypothetical protein